MRSELRWLAGVLMVVALGVWAMRPGAHGASKVAGDLPACAPGVNRDLAFQFYPLVAAAAEAARKGDAQVFQTFFTRLDLTHYRNHPPMLTQDMAYYANEDYRPELFEVVNAEQKQEMGRLVCQRLARQGPPVDIITMGYYLVREGGAWKLSNGQRGMVHLNTPDWRRNFGDWPPTFLAHPSL